MSSTETREAQLHRIARAYVSEGLAQKNFDAIPYDDHITLSAPFCPGGSDVPLTGKDTLRRVWWAPMPQLIGTATVLDSYVNAALTAVTCEFLLEILQPPCTLRIIDRFTVNLEGKIVEQANYFDPRNVTNPGWQGG